MFEKIASELKEAREKAGLSPEQIARIIKIDLKFLHLLEKGDFTFLPELYVKAFLRDYAKAVDIDEETIMKKFKLAKSGKSPEEAETEAAAMRHPDAQHKESVSASEEKKIVKKVLIDDRVSATIDPNEVRKVNFFEEYRLYLLAGLLFLIIGTGIYFVFFHSSDNEIIVEEPVEDIIAKSKNRYKETATGDVSTVAAGDSLILRITASDSSWVQILIDNTLRYEYFLLPQQSIIQKAQSTFDLTIGNSGAISLFLNDKELLFKKQTKRSMRLSVDKSGIKTPESSPGQSVTKPKSP